MASSNYINSNYPELLIYIDTDNNVNTGYNGNDAFKGSELCIDLYGPSTTRGNIGLTGGIIKVQYVDKTTTSTSTSLANDANNSWTPKNTSTGANTIEASLSLSNLGIAPGKTLRFYVQSRFSGDIIANNSTISNSNILYSLTKIKWQSISTVWNDNDQIAIQPSTEDLTKFGVTTDASKMYLYFETAQTYNSTTGTGNYPEINFYIDTDLNTSTGLNDPTIPEGKGAELKVIMVGPNSFNLAGNNPPNLYGGGIFIEKYNPKGGVNPAGVWIANGDPSSCPTCNSWLPRNKDNNVNFMEASLNLTDLGITKDNPIRFMVMSRWANDFIGANNILENSNLYYEMPRAPIQIDGVNTDWSFISTKWQDTPNDVGGAQNDLKSVGITSDNTNLYFSFNMEKPYDLTYNYPELLIYIDSDNNSVTGANGAEIALDFLVASSNFTPQGALRRVTYSPNAVVQKDNWLTNSYWQPNYSPNNSNFAEFYLPLSDLGLTANSKIRFYVEERWSHDVIGENKSLATTSLTYTLGSTVALDGNEDDWDANVNKREWIDPDNDAGSNERDLSKFSISQDKNNLYIYYKVAKTYTSLHPEVEVYFDTDMNTLTGFQDVNNPNNPGIGTDIFYSISGASSEINSQGGGYFSETGQIMRRVYDNYGRKIGIDEFSFTNIAPNIKDHTKDFLEVSIPLTKLKLVYGQKFRFFVQERFSGDILGQNSSIANSRLTFPNETVYIGALTNLNTDIEGTKSSTDPNKYNMNIDKILSGGYKDDKGNIISSYTQAIMGLQDLTFKSGKYFDVQLSMATDINFILNAWQVESSPIDFSVPKYYFDILKSKRISISPLINYHYLPDWFYVSENGESLTNKLLDKYGHETNGAFMPVSPNYNRYKSTTAINFTQKTIDFMKPYFGETINEVYVGNEVMYPNSRTLDSITSFDRHSEALWKSFVNDELNTDFQNLTQSTPFNKFIPDLWKFRSKNLIDLLKAWSYSTYNQSSGKIKVSTKLVPYSFYGDVKYLSSGYFPYIFDYLNDSKIKTIAIDSYIGTGGSNSDDLIKSYRLNKPISLSEFNCPENSDTEALNSLNANSTDIQNWILNGVANYNVRSASLFGWNIKTKVQGVELNHMTDDQKIGLKNSINSIIELDKPLTRKKLVRAIIPINLDFILTNSSTYTVAHIEVNNYFLGIQKIGTKCQELNKEIGFEIDYSTKDVQPDLTFKTIAQSCTLTTNELKNKKTIYLIRNKTTKLYILNSNDSSYMTISIDRNCGNSQINLSSNTFSISNGSKLIDNVSQWENGNGNFVLPTNQSNITIIGKTSCGQNSIIKIENSIFLASDILTYIGNNINDQQAEISSGFMSELIKKMVYNEPF